MAIEFLVEDGTGLSNSTSYVGLVEFRQYWENKGVDYTSTPDNTVKAWLNEATQFIDNNYIFCGTPLEEDQALQLPQADLYYRNGLTRVDGIPKEVEIATCEIAHYRQANPKGGIIDNNVKSKSIGPVSVTYNSEITSQTIKKSYSVANKQLSKICQITGKYVERV
jgi:hypothetical protein